MNVSKAVLSLVAALLACASAAPQDQPVPAQPAPQFDLLPVPATLSPAQGKFMIDAGFRAACIGYSEPRLDRALKRFLLRLQERTGIPLTVGPSTTTGRAQLEIRCHGAGERVQSVSADETYTLVVTPDRILLDARAPLGILRGLETLLQLTDLDRGSFHFPAVSIEDRPRFPWRGLMIDVARHWQPVEVIRRNLDAMAAVKMNVLHWHLSEDQGFRIESRKFPRLHGEGSDGLYYTQEQIREVVAHARERGIRVVPEFDMPGHTTAWFVGHPELASAPGPYAVERGWGVFDPCMDPTREEVYAFLDAFLGEIVPLFPDAYWHVGGDEVNGRQWNASVRISAFKKRRALKDNEDLQAYFNTRLVSLLTKHGKKAVGWDEILHPGLPKSAVIQSWRGQASLAQAAQQGYAGILSWGYYLDHLRPASFHYLVDPMGQRAAALSEKDRTRILGGEACMWGEYITYENIDSRIWPRAAAVAERLWSHETVRDVDDMYRRLDAVGRDLEALGLHHRSVYPQMMQRMTGTDVPEALKILGDIVEPVKQLARGRMRKYTSLTPMNRLVDAVAPESDRAREFTRRVDLALATAAGLAQQAADLRRWLTLWRDNHPALRLVLQDSFLLGELETLSENVSLLANAGIQALEYLESGRRPPETWSGEQAALLQRADRAQAELLIMIIPGVRKLIAAANQRPTPLSSPGENAASAAQRF